MTEARLEGRFEELEVDITGRGENVVVAGRRLDDLTLKVAGTLDSSVPNMTIALGGDLSGEPLRFDARLTGADAGALQLNDITGRFGPAALEGALALGPDGMPDGAVTLTVADFAAASDPALQGLRGSLRARVALSSDGGQARADIDLNGRGLARDDISVSALTAEITVADLLGTPAVSGSGALEDARAGGVDLGTVDVDAKVLEERGYLVSLSERGGTWTARSELDVSAGDEATVLAFETLKIDLQGTSIDLKKPTTLRIASDAVVLARTELGAGGGAVVAEGTLSPELDFRATLDKLPLSVLTPVLPDLADQGGRLRQDRGDRAARLAARRDKSQGRRHLHRRPAPAGRCRGVGRSQRHARQSGDDAQRPRPRRQDLLGGVGDRRLQGRRPARSRAHRHASERPARPHRRAQRSDRQGRRAGRRQGPRHVRHPRLCGNPHHLRARLSPTRTDGSPPAT